MKQFITTDSHFGPSPNSAMFHACGRPSNYPERIVRGWTSTVPDDAILYHLGDATCDSEELMKKYISWLPGKKILIRGNHDHKSDNWYLTHGWDFVCENITIKSYGKTILLSHKPRHIPSDVGLNIHGHFHNNGHHSREADLASLRCDRHRCMALEYHGYAPIELGALLHLMTSDKKTISGHTTAEIEAKCYVGGLPERWRLDPTK